MLIGYDGSSFHGFADQGDDVATVARSLRTTIGRVLGREPVITCAGRTDAGVHAWGQVVTFDAAVATVESIGLERLIRVVNRQLAPAVVARDVAIVDATFDARFSAKERRYRYSVLNAPTPDPFSAHIAWWVPDPLDVSAMSMAATDILGEHDFSSFCRRPRPDATLVRRVTAATWHDLGGGRLRFDVAANAFCHQMVRALTGQLVEIGRGRRRAASMAEVLAARDRQLAAPLAPPHGLCLWEVCY